MENLLIEFNQEKYNSDISSLQQIIEKMNEVIQTYNAMGIDTYSHEDFNGLFFNTENLIFEKIMKDKPAEVFGLKIDKKKFWDEYLVKPKGYYDLIAAIESFKKLVSIKLKYFEEATSYKIYLSFFEQLPNGNFEIKKSVLDKIKSKYETYVYSEKGKLAFKFATLIKEFLNKNGNLSKLQISSRRDLEYFVGEAVMLNDETASVRNDFITCEIIDPH
jgi:hypothetical protein